MLLYPALMVNEPHESQELVCFNPWRLYYESMMIWYIGLLHYISIILFSLSCYWISTSVPSRPSWNPLDILWQPHWYFSWFLIFAQQERSKCSGLSCPHYISPIKQLDAVIFLPHLPLEATALPHYSTLRNREYFYFYFILLNILTVCCTSLSVVCCLPKTEQALMDHATMTRASDTFHPSETSPTHPGTLLCWGSWRITLYS